jgi:hypothetical protein
MSIESRDDLKAVLTSMVRLEELTTMVNDLVLDLINDSDLWMSIKKGEPTLYVIVSFEEDEAGNTLTKDFSLEETLRKEFDNYKYFKTDTYSPEVRVIINWLRDLAEKLDAEFGDKIEAKESPG